MSVVDELISNNRRYAASFTGSGLPASPARRLAIVTCMDVRLDVNDLLGLELGEAHIIRNAGGVVTDDVLRSLLLSQRLLGTREIIVVHHTDCGMLNLDEIAFADEITRETGDKPDFAFHGFADLEDSVRESMQRLRDCPFLPHREAIRGFVYEVESGRLREVV